MDTRLLLGDEAIAHGALDAGISGIYAYPGTPSTEIMECVQEDAGAAARGVHRQWSTNEKTALEEALGMSYAGRRAIVCMKHVGLNVAADGFVNAAITGVHGGLVVVVADDPSMHSSQNEQDSRFYAKFAGVPLLEPSSQQESYGMVRAAFDLSEDLALPVMLRITTRLAHSRADVVPAAPRPARALAPSTDRRRWVLLPANARRNYDELVRKQAELSSRADSSVWNELVPGKDARLGILAAGIGLNYVREWYPEGCPHPLLKIGQYPVPPGLVAQLRKSCEVILVVEDGAPFIEEQIRGALAGGTARVRGRLDGALPRTGELSPESVAAALGLPPPASLPPSALAVGRPPMLCRGCPHIDTYAFLKEAMASHPEGRVFSDIGCYTLGALPPFDAIDTCVDMGASITMAKGAADAGLRPSVAVIGDSTFTHSGLTGLLDAVHERTPVTVLILDNDTTGMTGGQESMATGRLEAIVAGLGVEPAHLRIITPLAKHHAANVATLREELAYEGVSVVIARRACIQIKRKNG